MKFHVPAFWSLMVLLSVRLQAQTVDTQTAEVKIAPLIRDSCLACHDQNTTTRLNFEALDYDLTSATTFGQWERIFDRIKADEMPPRSEPRPDRAQRSTALQTLQNQLSAANEEQQRLRGRVPARRLTRIEYDYTIQDLLKIDGEFSSVLPEESHAASFDNVGSEQHFSAMHLESYIAAANKAIASTIRLHANPFRRHEFDLLNSEFLNSFHDKEIRLGGNISRKLDNGVVIFRDVDYLLRSDLHGFQVRSTGSGIYTIRITAEAFQSQTPVAMKLVVKDVNGQSNLIAAFDLLPGQTHSFQAKVWLTRTKVFYVAMAEERSPAFILADIFDAGGAKNYDGAGILVKSINVEGPGGDEWPSPGTVDLLAGVPIVEAEEGRFAIQTSADPLSDVRRIVTRLAPLAFRRPVSPDEVDSFVELAKPAIANKQDFVDVVKLPLQAMLCSPQFLMLTGEAGRLDDYALASRLSYFLWKTLPDEELLKLAGAAELSSPKVLAAQLDRMLQDERSNRFVKDFVGQWLRLNELNATTPDEKLYPEYDEILHWSVAQETEAFVRHLIVNNLSISNLIDSDFAFVNRRLAQHYDIDGVTGQAIRPVNLAANSLRGGLLTQASILKVTANGLVTSPVKRGAYVLTELLGTPPPPPPSNVGSIEPDTSGATTIRETLDRHRNVESCAGCHLLIDPPGFVLECFDPIGGLRTHYRKNYDDLLNFLKYEDGPIVDATSTASDGTRFERVQDLKRYLLQRQEQLARHLVSQLIVYSTGGEIEFADRDEVEAILERTRSNGFALKSIIHEVVHSKLFRNR